MGKTPGKTVQCGTIRASSCLAGGLAAPLCEEGGGGGGGCGGGCAQHGVVQVAVRQHAGHPCSLLDLKHELLGYENTSPQLFRWGPHLTSPLCEEGVGGGAAEWRDVDGCPAAGWPSPLYTRSETRSTN